MSSVRSRAQQLGRRDVLVERTGLRLRDPDPDQVARQVMASAERVKRLPGVVLGNDLTLQVGAVDGSGMGVDRALPAAPRPIGRPRTTDTREVVNAILYIASTGSSGACCRRTCRRPRRCSATSRLARHMSAAAPRDESARKGGYRPRIASIRANRYLSEAVSARKRQNSLKRRGFCGCPALHTASRFEAP